MTEAQLHKQICQYLKLKGCIFNTDMSGIKLTIGQAKKMKSLRSSRAFPDIVIYEPRDRFHGLFLEVKKESPYKKNGELKSGEHLREQLEMMDILFDKGYLTSFVWSFDMAKTIIDDYLEGRAVK
jgi:hypothetical protein